ncbi:MAG: FtsQ-type POTRA domain-containing protein, partial [Angelakisella sp.]
MEQGRYMRNVKRKKRGRKLLATAAFLVTVLSVAAVICLAMFFNIEQLLLAGATRYSTEQLIAASGVVKGQNIFAVSTKKAAATLYQSFPYLDQVKVKRLLPTTIQIIVEETSAAVAVVNSSKSYTLLGANDRVLEHISDVSTEGVPIVLGADLSQIAPGTKVNRQTLDNLYNAVGDDETLRPQLERMNA